MPVTQTETRAALPDLGESALRVVDNMELYTFRTDSPMLLLQPDAAGAPGTGLRILIE